MPASLPSPVSKPQLDRLEGLVERVTFHNADNGFCVLRLKVKGERELITLIGHAPTVAPGVCGPNGWRSVGPAAVDV